MLPECLILGASSHTFMVPFEVQLKLFDLDQADTAGVVFTKISESTEKETTSLITSSCIIYCWHRHFKSCTNTELPTHPAFLSSAVGETVVECSTDLFHT